MDLNEPVFWNKNNKRLGRNSTILSSDLHQIWQLFTKLYSAVYHQRSIIEAVFGAIKRMYGNHLRSRRRARQSREIAIRVICYNIEVVARSHVKSGRLTHESLTAMAA